MSLFPAYATDADDSVDSDSCGVVEARAECALLASDEEPGGAPVPAATTPAPAPAQEPYYRDVKRDAANLRVSTLYYPGRPEYRAARGALGARRERRRRERAPRYWTAPAPPERASPPRAPPAAAPPAAWLRYVRLHDERGALHAARAAAAACDSPRVRAALHDARARLCTTEQLLAELRAELAAERRPRVRLELWVRMLDALGPEGADAAAAAALQDLAAEPGAYPRVLYAHGCVLRAAGLWERLVLGVELTAAMSFPPSAAFPPPPDAAAERRSEEALQRREAAAAASGLPAAAVWARVERLRAAAHWRPAREAGPDPQRAPAASDAAELLRPVRGPAAGAELAVTLLRLAKVPLPGSERAARAAGPEPAGGEPALAEALAVLVRASRRLPPAHPARAPNAAAARAVLAPLLDPPHYFSDTEGYLSWCSALWEACCGWLEGARRVALLCWRLRWLHALALLAEPAEARRLRHEARAAVKRHAPAAPEAYAHAARIEAVSCGGEAGRRAAAHALRAALRDPAVPPENALFAARVLAELSPGGWREAGARRALCCAVLRRAPPDQLDAPSPEEEAEALRRCETECAALERAWQEPGEGAAQDSLCSALAVGAGEWGAARAVLAPPPERARLLHHLLHAHHLHREGCVGAALQYGEQTACALVLCEAGGARVQAARALHPLFPDNALLALLAVSAPGALATGAGGARAALAGALPALVAGEAVRGARACERAARAGGGALLAAARCDAEARADPHRQRALYAALGAYPDHKWLYVRGAARCGADAAALADAVLERGLRAHALPDELPHLAPATPTQQQQQQQ